MRVGEMQHAQWLRAWRQDGNLKRRRANQFRSITVA